MFAPDQYQLLDFGKGEKLELLGGCCVRRETPSVTPTQSRSATANWNSELRFEREGGWSGKPVDPWTVVHGQKTFLLKPTPAGQIGIFPEQAFNWQWIETLPNDLSGLKALNLFAYTGGTTLSLASRGAEVVHVDSAANVVKWARQNASQSGMDGLPIRWIVEDAMRFIGREIKRGSRYDIIVADPPTYGIGPKKERWKWPDGIDSLLAGMAQIAAPELRMIVLSGHTPGYDGATLEQLANEHFHLGAGQSESFSLSLKTEGAKRLESGYGFRYAS